MPEIQFELKLEIFRTEVESAIQFLNAFLSVHKVAAGSQPVLIPLNEAALFWKTSLGALQTAAFITLGRIFDQKSEKHKEEHNLNKLLRIAQDNQQIFSKEALRRRKQNQGVNLSPSELDDYLRDAYEPTPDDFRNLRKSVAKWRKIYENNYRGIRNQFFAHKGLSDREEIDALFAKTNIDELQSMLTFLSSLYNALWQLFFNGHKPDLSSPAGNSDLQESITREVERFLLKAAGVTQPKV